jgi:hypothetical protein
MFGRYGTMPQVESATVNRYEIAHKAHCTDTTCTDLKFASALISALRHTDAPADSESKTLLLADRD